MNLRTSLVVAAVTLTLAGCGGGDSSTTTAADPSPSSSATASQPSEAASGGPAIAPGTYTRNVSVKEVRALDLKPSDLQDVVGPDGTGMVAYKFEEAVWTEYHGPSEDRLERGSFGTHHYDDDGMLVISETCCGDSLLTWETDGSTLTMTLESSEVEVTPVDHLMRDGVYTKSD